MSSTISSIRFLMKVNVVAFIDRLSKYVSIFISALYILSYRLWDHTPLYLVPRTFQYIVVLKFRLIDDSFSLWWGSFSHQRTHDLPRGEFRHPAEGK